MNERTRAIEILKQAREVLLARLTERVVDGGEDILDDAAGLSYSGAIESLHDQLGQRLGNVTALLAHLQSADEAPVSFEVPPAEMSGAVPEVDAVFGVGIDGYGAETGPAPTNNSIAKDSCAHAGHGERSTRERAPAREPDWTGIAIDSDGKNSEESDGFALSVENDETAPDVVTTAPIAAVEPESIELPTREEQAKTVSRDRVVQEAVFQEADFRSVDLFAGDFEGSLSGAGDVGSLNTGVSGSANLPDSD